LNASPFAQTPDANGVNLPVVRPIHPAPERTPRRDSINGETESSSAQKSRRSLFKRVLLRAMMTLAGIGVVAFSYRWWTVGRFIESTDDVRLAKIAQFVPMGQD
jgi:hypothetical protein